MEKIRYIKKRIDKGVQIKTGSHTIILSKHKSRYLIMVVGKRDKLLEYHKYNDKELVKLIAGKYGVNLNDTDFTTL